MRSHTRREGLLMIDHRAGMGMGPVGHGTLLEMPTYTCSHCQRIVVLNPGRTRARAYCPKCDHRICDQCEAARVAAGGACRPFAQIADEHLEQAVRGLLTGAA